jgi:hypothetical protein
MGMECSAVHFACGSLASWGGAGFWMIWSLGNGLESLRSVCCYHHLISKWNVYITRPACHVPSCTCWYPFRPVSTEGETAPLHRQQRISTPPPTDRCVRKHNVTSITPPLRVLAPMPRHSCRYWTRQTEVEPMCLAKRGHW